MFSFIALSPLSQLQLNTNIVTITNLVVVFFYHEVMVIMDFIPGN